MLEGNYFSLTKWFANFELDGRPLINHFQREYLWKPYKILNTMNDAKEFYIKRQEKIDAKWEQDKEEKIARDEEINEKNKPQNDAYIGIGEIKVKKDGRDRLTAEGGQRTVSLILANKAVADASYVFQDSDLGDYIMQNICYKNFQNREPMILISGKLDREDLQIIFKWQPHLDDLYTKKRFDLAKKMGEIDDTSPFLINYFAILKEIIRWHDEEGLDMRTIFNILESICFTVFEMHPDQPPTEVFRRCNTQGEPVSNYDLFKSFLYDHLNEDCLEKYLDNVGNSRQFRKNSQKKFLPHILAFVAKVASTEAKSYTEIVKFMEKEVKRGIYKSEEEGYEVLCKQIFQLYGRTYVAFLEEDETILTQDMLKRVRDMKQLTESLWQVVALGSVCLLDRDNGTFHALDESQQELINKMFDIFIRYAELRLFSEVKGASLTMVFYQFFIKHSFADDNIVSAFKHFLSVYMDEEQGKGKMPNTVETIQNAMLMNPTKSAISAYRVVLEHIDRYVNVKQNIDYSIYTAEHIASTSTRRTENYDFDDKDRKCFANLTLLTPDENNKAGEGYLAEKRDLVYDQHPLAIVNQKHIRQDIRENKGLENIVAIAANATTDWGKKQLISRANALAILLLKMKDDCFA